MTNELREAAERLRRWRLLGGMETEQAIWSGNSTVRGTKISEDQDLVMKAYLAEHQPDDGEQADETWLQSMNVSYDIASDNRVDLVRVGVIGETQVVELFSHDKPITRGQVRLIIRSLGGA